MRLITSVPPSTHITVDTKYPARYIRATYETESQKAIVLYRRCRMRSVHGLAKDASGSEGPNRHYEASDAGRAGQFGGLSVGGRRGLRAPRRLRSRISRLFWQRRRYNYSPPLWGRQGHPEDRHPSSSGTLGRLYGVNINVTRPPTNVVQLPWEDVLLPECSFSTARLSLGIVRGR